MLKIINDMEPFFEDCYRRINVREYARVMQLSPPTASKVLESYSKAGLLLREKYRKYLLFYANKNSKDFIDLSRIYWRGKLSGTLSHIEKNLANPTVVLFGSLSKAEAKPDSDVDLAIFTQKKELSIERFDKNREMQIFCFKSLKDVKNSELKNNIINGYVLLGKLEV